MEKDVDGTPSPGPIDSTLLLTTPATNLDSPLISSSNNLLEHLVDDHCMVEMNQAVALKDDLTLTTSASLKDLPKDTSSDLLSTQGRVQGNSSTLGHQGVQNTGGKIKHSRVVYCQNMNFSMNFEEVHLLSKQFGKVERIRLVENGLSLDSYIVFCTSASAIEAQSRLDGHSVNNCTLKTRLFDEKNLRYDANDYLPEDDTPIERKAPLPKWFVATYKEGQDNFMLASDILKRALNGVPPTNMKKYGKGILIKSKNSLQGRLLSEYKPPQYSNIKSVSPHSFFNSVKGVVYSKDLFAFSEEEILHRSPPNVFQVKKLRGVNHAVLFTFSSDHLPEYINFGDHVRMRVRKFRPNPKQCRKCFEYGHLDSHCSNEERCHRCSEIHEDKSSCSSEAFCFLCDGEHSPSSNECPRKKFEREVLETANVEHISIGTAKRQVLGANKSENSSYASALKKLKSPKSQEIVYRVIPSKSHPPKPPRKAPASNGNRSNEASQSSSGKNPQPASKPKQVPKDSSTNRLPATELDIHAAPESQTNSKDSHQASAMDTFQDSSLPDFESSTSNNHQCVVPQIVEVHRSAEMEVEGTSTKRPRTPSPSPPQSPSCSGRSKNHNAKSLEDLSVKKKTSSEKSSKLPTSKENIPSSRPSLSRFSGTGPGERIKKIQRWK